MNPNDEYGFDELPQHKARLIPIDLIEVDHYWNCRGYFTLESVEDLAKDIAVKGFPDGLNDPVTVRPIGNGRFKLVCGHRRYVGCVQFLKWEKIPAKILILTDAEADHLNFVENLLRQNLNMLQEARHLERAYSNLSCREVAAKLSKTERWVLTRRKLLTLPEEVQIKAAVGLITAANVERIGRLKSREEQLDALSQFEARKRKARNAPFTEVSDAYQGGFRPRKSKAAIQTKISHLFNRGVTGGLPTRVMAWAAGQITDAELEPDIDEYLALLEELKEWRTGQRRWPTG